MLVRADCREWLASAAHRHERFDLVFLDPPTFSNSKRMDTVLDIRRDHASLADACRAILAPGGLLVFSTNAQRFKLDEALRAIEAAPARKRNPSVILAALHDLALAGRAPALAAAYAAADALERFFGVQLR